MDRNSAETYRVTFVLQMGGGFCPSHFSCRKAAEKYKKPSKTETAAFDGFPLLVQIETPFEAIYTSAGINQLLLTGEERVTL